MSKDLGARWRVGIVIERTRDRVRVDIHRLVRASSSVVVALAERVAPSSRS